MNATLSRGAQIAGGCAAAVFVISFLPWYNAHGVGSANANLWKLTYTDLLVFLTVLVTGAWVAALATSNELAGNLRMATLGLSGLSTFVIFCRIVDQPGPNKYIDLKIWAFLGLIAMGGVVYGALQSEN